MGKLAARDSEVNRPFKPQICQSKRRGQSRYSYDTLWLSKLQKTDIDLIAVAGEISMDRTGLNQGKNKTIEEKILEATWDHIKILEDRIAEYTGVIIGMKITVKTVVKVVLWNGHFQEITILVEEKIETQAIVDQGLDQQWVQRDRIRCYKCREYDHFTRDCLTSKEEREIEQLQQIFNLAEEHTSLNALATNMYDSLNKINLIENIRQEHLNL